MQGFFVEQHRNHRRTSHDYKRIKKWERIGLNCKNDKIFVLCAGGRKICHKEECWMSAVAGWRRVILHDFIESFLILIKISAIFHISAYYVKRSNLFLVIARFKNNVPKMGGTYRPQSIL